VHHPDQLIFDLDPPDGFEAARRAAFDLRALLDDLGLPALVKTAGSHTLRTVPQRLEDNDDPWPRLRGRSLTKPRRRLNTISQEH
jgi:DNA primase